MSREFPLTLKDDADFNLAINAVRQEFLICETALPRAGLQSVYPLIEYKKKAASEDIETVLDQSGDEEMKEPPKSQGSTKHHIKPIFGLTKKREPRVSKTSSKYLQTRLLLPRKRAVEDSEDELSEDASYESNPDTHELIQIKETDPNDVLDRKCNVTLSEIHKLEKKLFKKIKRTQKNYEEFIQREDDPILVFP
jgi:hypothetical protein